MNYSLIFMTVFLIYSCQDSSKKLPTDFRITKGNDALSYDSVHFISLSKGLIKLDNNGKFIRCRIDSIVFYFSKEELIDDFDKLSDLSLAEMNLVNFIKVHDDIEFTLDSNHESTKSGISIAWYFCEMMEKGKYFTSEGKELYEVEYLEYSPTSFTISKRYADNRGNFFWFCPPIETADFELTIDKQDRP